ncbi:fungal-specific transcription factor domain-containing protein, partial [Xylariales sp. PMI_506]
LPPYDEVVSGIQTLTTSYFQLGFIHKALFFEQLRNDRNSVSPFLLFSILSVSARFTPCLVKRYQGGPNATQVFLERATCLIQEQMFHPTLDSIQGFFLMSIAEWGNGEKHKSLIYMGIAVRLAGILRLHREETYRLPPSASKEEVVQSEVTRRTFWMLETFENLHSGSDSPIAFSYRDITVLLPCDEREFTFGIQPGHRAALSNTPPALKNPSTQWLPSRSLFATLLQTHNLWGQVARLVSTDMVPSSPDVKAGLSVDDYRRLSQTLVEFERGLPTHHTWSVWNLRAFKVEVLDLAFLSAVMVLRLSNIILRRSYLHDVLSTRSSQGETVGLPAPITETWETVAEELFDNMLVLHEQITAFFTYRHADQGYPALIVFSVYVCGSLANHLRQQPQICPRVAPRAVKILQKSIQGLGDLQFGWPLARRWYNALCKAS